MFSEKATVHCNVGRLLTRSENIDKGCRRQDRMGRPGHARVVTGERLVAHSSKVQCAGGSLVVPLLAVFEVKKKRHGNTKLHLVESGVRCG